MTEAAANKALTEKEYWNDIWEESVLFPAYNPDDHML
jgi:hypothetical protein